ncbi:unnamed protein product [Vicia faba]|uniref:Uncharacterized protein n=1 Tax=Vicia faba TaxID=3906 RepID=A0AAV1B8I2_VICFA|nr:unnamed protein product [Vicia faba]
MKLSELGAAGTKCKEHINDKQLPGVCYYCLRDKLSKVNNNNSNNKQVHHVSQSPQHFFSSSSNYMSQSQGHSRRHHRRQTSSVMDSFSSDMVSFNYGLKKSKSIAFVSTSQIREREVYGNYKKRSFWSKLLKFTRKDVKECIQEQ